LSQSTDREADASGEPAFEADVQIGKGLRTIDRHGTARIGQGRIMLTKGNGDVIVEAPMSEVRADKARFTGGGAAKISIADETYTIAPLRVHRAAPDRLAGSASNLARDIGRLKQGRELTELFLSVVEAEGGQVAGS
jgi:hypothetical protein